MAQTLVRVLVHLILSTKELANLVGPDVESELHAYLAGIANNLDSPCLVVNGTSDHVHTLVCQSKNLALAKLVEGVKKGSSKWIKTKSAALRSFHGQGGYAPFPSARRRPWRKVTSPAERTPPQEVVPGRAHSVSAQIRCGIR
jgi:putative transposase